MIEVVSINPQVVKYKEKLLILGHVIMSMDTSSFTYMNNYLTTISISLMLVALGIAISGIGFARLRTMEGQKVHRWMMSGGVILSLISISLVMFPSLFMYYLGGYSITSGFSILQIIHSVEGAPAVALSLMYLFNDLPTHTRKWMRITAVLWITSVALGVAVYWTMPF